MNTCSKNQKYTGSSPLERLYIFTSYHAFTSIILNCAALYCVSMQITVCNPGNFIFTEPFYRSRNCNCHRFIAYVDNAIFEILGDKKDFQSETPALSELPSLKSHSCCLLSPWDTVWWCRCFKRWVLKSRAVMSCKTGFGKVFCSRCHKTFLEELSAASIISSSA